MCAWSVHIFSPSGRMIFRRASGNCGHKVVARGIERGFRRSNFAGG